MLTKFYIFCMNALALPIVGLIMLLNIIHPFVHGTFLDGGALDSGLIYLNVMAAGMVGGYSFNSYKHKHS